MLWVDPSGASARPLASSSRPVGVAESAWRAALRGAAAALLPRDCAGCGAADQSLCPDCTEVVRGGTAQIMALGPLPVAGSLVYEGAVAQILGEYKEQGRSGLARPLSAALRVSVAALARELLPASGDGRSGILVVPVPGSRASYRRRGWHPVDLLARRAGLPVSRMLVPTRALADQAALGRDARRRNLHGALRAQSGVRGRAVLLVDDVLTSGATLREAARAIEAGGGRAVAAAVIARTPLRSDPGVAPASPGERRRR